MMDWLEAFVALAFLLCFVMVFGHIILWAMP